MIVDLGRRVIPVEIKAGRTVAGDFFAGLDYWRGLLGRPDEPGALVYGGDDAFRRRATAVTPWFTL